MKRIFISCLIISALVYLPAFGFGETGTQEDSVTLLGGRITEDKSKDADDKESSSKHKKKKGKNKILIPPNHEDVVLTLDEEEKEN